jgi:ABC-2 type transport system ATP-binding protein
MSESETVIRLVNASKTFVIRDKSSNTIRDGIMSLFKYNPKRRIKAVQNIDLEIKKGEFFGVIGRNGSGKSTLLNLMTKAYPVDKGGSAEINGRFITLTLGMGFNSELTTRQNIYTNASILGLTFRQIGEVFDFILDFAELHDFVDTKIKYFSKGMVSRLSFAIALHAKADIFLMDEFFGGVGDTRFNKKCKAVFKRSFIDGRTIVHVSHKMGPIVKHCDRVLLLNKGKMVQLGKPEEVIKTYKRLYNES